MNNKTARKVFIIVLLVLIVAALVLSAVLPYLNM
ncbi:stressosome-associated protein Prli42 [Macrococcoides bohemicum]|uniref:Stressosome-associated protein Prli42 n=1 Tax=Macrococcoides bohemicum TaxID=1903056 RepID=A0AAE7U8R5_9STAP|nr:MULTISPECIES: stressosome-associated protein Prli42 [Macrococcus]MBC9873271.1 stressosome-associated protein Prli42 [Macrococcus bohemicus]MCG7420519.1 stressosome-associated protein Prli42 [Macrococcus epidermidis]MCH4986245.1 stressosome-associated protein Prli42 [Macrococcus sp. PK]QRN50023.1 stressosome-associated protein Prli42 [Macrococcus bohemicus]QYA41463.1 stressosome-associated protein Prli42 [Macrococcus bohemicus]